MGQFLLLAGAGLQASAQAKEAGAKKVELDLAKRDESSAAQDREVQRRRRIAAIIGTQAAVAAAKGLELSGSVSNISIVDARRSGEESIIDDVNTRGRISSLNRNRRTIGRAANVRSLGTLLRAGSRSAQRG